MPNWCCNSLDIEGPAEAVAKVQELVRNKDEVFSLDKIIKRPSELDDICMGGTNLNGEQLSRWREVNGKPVKVDEAALRKKYGFADWYEWSLHYWGTKWDVMDATLDEFSPEHIRYKFDTAWSPPEPAIRALSLLFPTLTIRLEYSEEDNGIEGKLIFKGGEANDA